MLGAETEVRYSLRTCSGAWRGVETEKKRKLFRSGTYTLSTNVRWEMWVLSQVFGRVGGEKLQSDLTIRPPTLSFLMYQLVCTILTFTVHALLPYLTQVR